MMAIETFLLGDISQYVNFIIVVAENKLTTWIFQSGTT
jgi:hypothetical protein